MIPYRRQTAIDAGSLTILAADVAPGDVLLVRRPGSVDRTAETVLSADNRAGGSIVLTFEGFTLEPSRDIPVGVSSFNVSGSWRQLINGN